MSSSSPTVLRDRKSRRLTQRYAEALEEQTRRRRQRESDIIEIRESPNPEEESEDRPISHPSKRQKIVHPPIEIVEGKRKPKANVRLRKILTFSFHLVAVAGIFINVRTSRQTGKRGGVLSIA